MRSTLCLLTMLSFALTACASLGSVSSPSVADVSAVTEKKPRPTALIVEDSDAGRRASAQYGAEVEAWGDRLHAAGTRLCRYFKATGMKGLTCE